MKDVVPFVGVPLCGVILLFVRNSIQQEKARNAAIQSGYPEVFLGLDAGAKQKQEQGEGKFDFERWATKYAWQPPFSTLPFTPTLTCEPSTSLLMDRFDWQLVPQSGWNVSTGCGAVDRRPWVNKTWMDNPT